MFQGLDRNAQAKGRHKNYIHPLNVPCWTPSKTFVNCGYE